MVDNLTPEQRSLNMSRIKSKDTQPELLLRRALWSKGLRYRVQYKSEGTPDIAFPKKKVAVFVDGCFWHKCPSCFKEPKSNKKYWKPKLERNLERAKEVNKILESQGWKVLRFYECRIKKDLEGILDEIRKSFE